MARKGITTELKQEAAARRVARTERYLAQLERQLASAGRYGTLGDCFAVIAEIKRVRAGAA